MTIIETLLGQRWIVKAEDKELYYRVKDQISTVKKFFTEKLGYQLLVNPYVIKLEKLPAKSEAWMGIQEFTENVEYEFLCMILAFLEDKEIEEQFVLSELTEFIKANFKEETIDWTLYAYRRHLIKVLKFCIQNAFFLVDDGSEDSFRDNYEGEVLYENTGVSRYFMHNFGRNIMDFLGVQDFESAEWIDTKEDRGIVRRQRVYRKLLMSPAVYKETEADEDFAYIKNYRNLIADDFQKYFECELQVHKTSSYLIIGENSSIGREFPGSNTISDILLLCNQLLTEEIRENDNKIGNDEIVKMPIPEFQRVLEKCKEQYGKGFIKTYREKSSTEFCRMVMEEMEFFGFIEVNQLLSEVLIRPVVGKVIGRYPKDFESGGKERE